MFARSESLKELVRRLVDESAQRHDEARQWQKEMRVVFAENRTALEEFREFNREILLRNEKVYSSVIVRLEDLGTEVRANTEETRAQTKALLTLIDRFDDSGGAAAA